MPMRAPRPIAGGGQAPALLALAAAQSLILVDRGLYILDEGSLLSIADRVARGDVLYRDVCTAIFPGIYYLLGAAFRITGPSIPVERGIALVVYLLTVLALHRLGTRLAGEPAGALGALLFVLVRPCLFPINTVLNYTQVSLCFALVALHVATGRLDETSTWRRPALAGTLAAMCGLFKQNFGASLVVVVAALWLLRPGPALHARAVAVATFGAAGALVAAVPLGLLAAQGALPELHRNAVRGPVAVVPGAYKVPWAPLLPADELHAKVRVYLPSVLADLHLDAVRREAPRAKSALVAAVKGYYLLPLAIAAAALLAGLRSSGRPGIAALVALHLLLYAGTFPRTDFSHLTVMAPTSALLAAVALGSLPPRLARAGALAVSGAALAVGAAFVGLILAGLDTPLATRVGTVRIAAVDAGRIRRIVGTIERRVPEGAPLFVVPVDSFLYVATGRRNPTRFDYLEPVNMGEPEARETAERLERSSVAHVVYSDRDLHDMNVPRLAEYAAPLHDYLLAHYRPVVDDVGPFDELYLCERAPAREAPLVDLLPARWDAEVVGPRGARREASSLAVVEFLAARSLELVPPADPSERLEARTRVVVPDAPCELRGTLLGRPGTFWRFATAGVVAEVTVVDGERRETILEGLYDPSSRRGERSGRPFRLDLSPYRGREVEVRVAVRSPLRFEVRSYAAKGYGIAWPGIYATGDGG